MQYKRKLAKGEKYWYKFDLNGKTYSSPAIYQTVKEAKKAEADRLSGLEEELKIVPLTFKELCEKRLDYIQTAKTDSYYQDHRLILRPLVAKFGNRQVRDISKTELSEHLTLLSKRLKSENKDNYLVNFNIRILKALFYYAIDVLEVIDKNPIKGIKPFPVKKKLKYIPPNEHLELIESHINGERLNLFIFMKETAARISEALMATTEDLGDGVILWTRKSRNGNLVPRRIVVPALDDRIWPTEGRLFNSWTDYPRWLEDLCRELKIRQFGWHALRHRKASLMAKTHTIVEIRDFLGHSSVNTTNIYLQQLGVSVS